MRSLIWIFLLSLFSLSCLAETFPGLIFSQKDWEVTCDNAGTCRAAGYGVEMGQVSVLLSRKAGPNTPVTGQVTFAQSESEIPANSTAHLIIDSIDMGSLDHQKAGYFRFKDSETDSLVQALLHDKHIEISLNGIPKKLSGSGVNAIFLKMDDYQGRIGTPQAILRRGEKREESVPKAVPAPDILTMPVLQNAHEQALSPAQRTELEPLLIPQRDKSCEGWANSNILPEQRQFTIVALDNKHSLVKQLCWRAAYDEGYALWVVDSTSHNKPELVTSDASSYTDGLITSVHRGRGLADCMTGEEWKWNGKSFVQSSRYTTGMCREIVLGGTWMLPSFVTTSHSQADVDVDNAALRTLYNTIQNEKKRNPELDLGKVVEKFPLTGNATYFDINLNENYELEVRSKPSDNITDDEWKAFLHSDVSADTENRVIHYTLIDLDNDGERDLIISSYIGGTGLFNFTGVLKRTEDLFVAINSVQDNSNADEYSVPGEIFSERDRGANQWGEWVRINGQVYALWFNGVFGEDNLYLIRPFSTQLKTPNISIRYHYKLDEIESEEEGQPIEPPLNGDDKATLLKSLDTMQKQLLKDHTFEGKSPAICPVPLGTSPEDAESYSIGMALHYVYETVAYVPVWVKGECYIGIVGSHHGYYNGGIDANISIVSPQEDGDAIGGYFVSGKRDVVSIKYGWEVRVGDEGI